MNNSRSVVVLQCMQIETTNHTRTNQHPYTTTLPDQCFKYQEQADRYYRDEKQHNTNSKHFVASIPCIGQPNPRFTVTMESPIKDPPNKGHYVKTSQFQFQFQFFSPKILIPIMSDSEYNLLKDSLSIKVPKTVLVGLANQ